MVPHEFFGTVRQKKSKENRDTHESLEIPKILKLKSGSWIFSRTVRQKFSTEESDFPFSCIESFEIRIFLEG